MQFDPQLIERLVQHDDLAFGQFYELTVDQFFRYVVSHYTLSPEEAHDIVSDVYIKIWDNLTHYDKNYTFGQYVRTILKNHCKDYFKKTKPLFFSHLEDERGNNPIDTEAKSLSRQEEKELKDIIDDEFTREYLQQALDSLEPHEQELIHSRYVLHYSYDILSDMTGISSDALRQQLSRIIKKLRKNLSFLQQ